MKNTLSTRPPRGDKAFLICMIEFAISELVQKRRQLPTKKEILDHLFSEARDDDEARLLERKLDRLLDKLLHEEN